MSNEEQLNQETQNHPMLDSDSVKDKMAYLRLTGRDNFLIRFAHPETKELLGVFMVILGPKAQKTVDAFEAIDTCTGAPCTCGQCEAAPAVEPIG